MQKKNNCKEGIFWVAGLPDNSGVFFPLIFQCDVFSCIFLPPLFRVIFSLFLVGLELFSLFIIEVMIFIDKRNLF